MEKEVLTVISFLPFLSGLFVGATISLFGVFLGVKIAQVRTVENSHKAHFSLMQEQMRRGIHDDDED